MTQTNQTAIKNGVFYLDGKETFFLSADYPYYRDSADNWQDRLTKLKEGHFTVISFYVPWRHHLVNGSFDFAGKTAANRDVRRFIRMCGDNGFYVLLKPGPFIHAETDFGGLPDTVNPAANSELDAMLNGKYETRAWHNPLPSPTDPRFIAMIAEWYAAVDEELIRPNAYPAGPVVSLQILNEGVYSDAQHPVTEYDYSRTSIDLFRSMLETKYGSIERYNELHGTALASLADVVPPSEAGKADRESALLAYLDWAEYQSFYMAYLYDSWGSHIKTELPFILNLNPPHDREQGYDDWFNRLEIEKFGVQNYGYTNWIGVVSHDPSAFNRYLLLTKRGRGPNLEENWGFSKLYDYRYKYTAIPFFQTVMAVAGGATGFNVYTAVGTDQWDDQIDTMQEKPYPDCSPVSETGQLTDKYYAMKLLNRFFREFGGELMQARADAPLTWAVYNRYAQLGCWGLDGQIEGFGRKPVHLGRKGFDRFQTAVRKDNADYRILNLAGGAPAVEEHPLLVLVGGFFMEAKVQQHLVDYVQAGGRLVLTHDLPVLDEVMLPCRILRDALFGAEAGGEGLPADGVYGYGEGQVLFQGGNLFEDDQSAEAFLPLAKKLAPEFRLMESDAQVWVHRHPAKDAQFYFILGLADEEKTYTVVDGEQTLRVALPAKSSAIVRVEAGRISAGVVKGIHEFEKSYTAPRVAFGEETVEADQPCDLYFAVEGGELICETATGLQPLTVQVVRRQGGAAVSQVAVESNHLVKAGK